MDYISIYLSIYQIIICFYFVFFRILRTKEPVKKTGPLEGRAGPLQGRAGPLPGRLGGRIIDSGRGREGGRGRGRGGRGGGDRFRDRGGGRKRR